MMHESAALIERLKRVAAGGGARQGETRAADAWCREGLERGRLHELVGADAGDAGAAAGFAVASALVAAALPMLWLRTEGAERQAGRLAAAGAGELGLDPAALLLGLVPDETALLRAAADAARCAGLGTVLVEAWGPMRSLDLTATRRLMLAAEGSGVTVLLLRVAAPPTQSVGASAAPSAAASRWGIGALPSVPLDAGAPGGPAFSVECLRRRDGPSGQRWRVEWNRETRSFAPLDPPGLRPADPAPLFGAGVPVAAGRAAALDPPAPVRRAG